MTWCGVISGIVRKRVDDKMAELSASVRESRCLLRRIPCTVCADMTWGGAIVSLCLYVVREYV